MSPAELPTFTEFFKAVHGHGPFPWQAALADRLLAGEDWPEAVDVPTGLGKTSLLDIALYTAAAGAADRRRRVFFIVDRRLVVDEAFEHANVIADLLNGHTPPSTDRTAADLAVLAATADRLRQPEDQGPVVEVTRMRGGTTWSWQWIQRPDRHALVVGTVDQIGSRLFLRGYGVSDRLRPIDAALVGTDSLILVDEAHLAQAMLTSIDAATADQPEHRLARPRVVQMSATVKDGAARRTHSIGEADHAHPVASLRLTSPRWMHLVEPEKVTKKNASQVITAQLAAWAQALAEAQPMSGPVVLVVCNTVARARAVFTALAQAQIAPEQRVLLIGRSRPVDRQRLMDTFYDRIQVKREHGRESEPLYVVATQTVEVGANIDADALVSESASMTALIQRLGRLARTPETREAPATGDGRGWRAPAIIVHDPSVEDEDPVYGSARQGTWRLLSRLCPPLATHPKRACVVEELGTGIEVSPTALTALLAQAGDEERAAMREQAQAPPVMHPGVLRSWEHTSPTPVTDPPVAPFLHGLDTRDPDVTVLWREDIHPATCLDKTGKVSQTVVERLRLVPPSSDEQLQVSLTALRRWRNRHHEAAGQITDLETAPAPQDVEEAAEQEYVLRYRGHRDLERITLNQVRPGDTLILPSSFGGCDRYGWAPQQHTGPVVDVADLASRRGFPTVRLDQRLIHTSGLVDANDAGAPAQALRQALQELLAVQDASEERGRAPEPGDYRAALKKVDTLIQEQHLRHPLATNLTRLAHAAENHSLLVKILPAEDTEPRTSADTGNEAEQESLRGRIVLAARRVLRGGDTDEASASTTNEPEPVWLDDHQDQVARQAAAFARNIGLTETEVHAVYLAGLYHDEGKRDPRFQTILRGGFPLPAAQIQEGRVLAKSLQAPTDPTAREQALHASGYPPGTRHEGLSARIAQHHLDSHGLDEQVRDLVLHLVASHHGRSRPLLPPVPDPAPVQVPIPGTDTTVDTADLLDWRSPARFARLNHTHGRWKLTLLEAVVRMADMWCSAGRPVTATTHTPPRPHQHPTPAATAAEVHTVTLPALDGRDPLGFLTGLGVLRLLHQHLGPDRVRLSFDPFLATAQITSPLGDVEQISTALHRIVQDIPTGGALPQVQAAWPPQIGVGKDPLRVPRHHLQELRDRTHQLGGEHAPAWLHTIVTDLATDKDGRVALTPFMAPAGGQKAATFFSKPLELVLKDPAVLNQALTGWQRLDGCTGENLDHRAIRTAVDTTTGASTPNGVPGATWLATQALPLLPLSGDGRHLRSGLWYRHNRQRIMLWPVWKHPLDLDGVQALLTHPNLEPQPTDQPTPRLDRKGLAPLGVLTIAAAQRRPIPGGKSAGVLTPMPIDLF
ncbi:type I-U CRISPR-associated helicase/endonuclease Cas3 [Nocardiopsis alba]|uniref:Type I-U CRISPR-associated helicase/endonuclease Cas3 n=1 Tax=Nocardiopsis alba TaxID=53437 RepID=A0A7K2INQ7_9ACTN|nr:type I-U CRISPR-associated helicase/endonuclease Cas3 [Nocardiopsis alba]MYR31404.1 type I-U CRISPR-associated helicase/endonuclease Cas3 [Nocardiopsis alba]